MDLNFSDLIDNTQINNFNNYKNINKKEYSGLYPILGNELINKIQNIKPFVIGAGAIGCEITKLLGM
jgi:hypothetical protein